MRRDRGYLLLEEPNLYRAFLLLALPVFGANFMKAFNDLVDTFFIGQMANSVAAQAGVSIAWPLLNIFAAFQAGLGIAGVAVISQRLGAKDRPAARRYSGLLVLLSASFGFALNLLLWLLCPAVMRLMGAEGQVLACAVEYTRIRSFELLFTLIFFAFQAIRQAQGDTSTPVLLSVGAVLLNIALTALFVQGMGMGVAGAALATVLGQAAIFPLCLYLLFRPGESLQLRAADLRFAWQPVRRLAQVAAPAALSQALSSLGFLVLQALILDYGQVVTAAFSIGNKISNMLLMPVLALGSVLAAYVGQNVGAGNPGRARQAYLVSRNIGLLVAVLGSLLLLPLIQQLVALLTNDAATHAAAAEYMLWVLLTQPLMSLFQNYLGVFNGSGNTGYSFLISTARLWLVRLPLILAFKHFTPLGRQGIWYAMVISNFVIVVFAALLFRRVGLGKQAQPAAPG